MTRQTTRLGLVQGSDEWHEWRRTLRMASEAPIIMDAAPKYWDTRTWEQLREKHAGLADPADAKTEALYAMGHAGETTGRLHAEKEFSTPYPAACYVRGDYGASVDGAQDANGDPFAPEWLEIKTCRSESSPTWRAGIDEKRIPMHIWWQMVHQAHVLDPTGDCALVTVCGGAVAIARVPVDDLLASWPALMRAWQSFARGDEQHIPPPGWRNAEAEWISARDMLALAKQEEARTREKLIAMAGQQPTVESDRVKLTRIESEGRVNWRKLAGDLALHVDDGFFRARRYEHTSEPSTSYRLTVKETE